MRLRRPVKRMISPQELVEATGQSDSVKGEHLKLLVTELEGLIGKKTVSISRTKKGNLRCQDSFHQIPPGRYIKVAGGGITQEYCIQHATKRGWIE